MSKMFRISRNRNRRALAWEFVYRLKLRSVSVKSIPALPFCFFNPEFLRPNALSRSRGYQTIYSDDIPLVVKPRPQPEPVPKETKPVRVPETVYQLADVRLDERETFSVWLLLALGLLALLPWRSLGTSCGAVSIPMLRGWHGSGAAWQRGKPWQRLGKSQARQQGNRPTMSPVLWRWTCNNVLISRAQNQRLWKLPST